MNTSLPANGTQARHFFVIEETPNSGLYWHQSRTEWVSLLEADHYPSEEFARGLIARMPYMHRFFRDAVLLRLTVALDPTHPVTRLLGAGAGGTKPA